MLSEGRIPFPLASCECHGQLSVTCSFWVGFMMCCFVLVLESIKTNLKANIASKETAPKLIKCVIKQCIPETGNIEWYLLSSLAAFLKNHGLMCIFLPLDSRDASVCCHKLFPPFGVISPPLLHMPHPSSSSQLRKAKTSWLHSGLAWGSPWADEGAWASKPPWESAGAMNRGPKTCCSLCIPVAVSGYGGLTMVGSDHAWLDAMLWAHTWRRIEG